MLAKGQITVSNLDDGKTPFLHQAYKMKDGRFLKHYPVYEASPVNGYKEGDLWHRTDGSQPGYFVANKSNTTLNLSDWTFYANELAYSDIDKFYPKFEGTYSDYNKVPSDDQTKYTWKIIKADDGIGIKSVKEYYAVSASNVTPPSLQRDWSETPKPTNTTNKYLWNYEVYTYSNGDARETTKRVIGTHGATGATGNGITSVTNYYLATTLGTGVTGETTATQQWKTEVQKTDPVNKYLWNYEKILYTNGSNIPTAPVIIGTHGEKGDKGSTGVGIKNIQEFYLASPLGKGVTRSTNGWTSDVQVIDSDKKYLWNYEQINYDNNTNYLTAPVVIGTFGSQGIGVKGVTEYYLASPLSKDIRKDTNGWTTEMQPLTPENKYLWNKEIVHYTDDESALKDKTEVLSGTEIFTDKADDAVVHVDIDGKSYQHAGSGKNLCRKNTFTGAVFSTTETTNAVDKVIEHNIPISPSSTYTLSGIVPSNLGLNIFATTTKVNESITSHNSMYSHVATGGIGVQTTNYKVPVGYNYVTITTGGSFQKSYHNIGTSLTWSNIQLEEGSVATAYEPPAPTPDYPVEIHSLNNMDVVSSVGKRNYFAQTKVSLSGNIAYEEEEDAYYNIGTNPNFSMFRLGGLGLDLDENYVISFEIKVLNEEIQFKNSTLYINGAVSITSHSNPTLVKDEWVKVYSNPIFYDVENTAPVHIYFNNLFNERDIKFRKFQVEKSTKATDWSPAPDDITEDSNHLLIDKINLLLDEPLRSVGDVKDMLYRDSDGLWKVERKTTERIISGGMAPYRYSLGAEGINTFYTSFPNAKLGISTSVSSHFKNVNRGWDYHEHGIGYSDHSSTIYKYFYFPDSLTGISESDSSSIATKKIDNWLTLNPVSVVYQLANPVMETLPQSLQDKLNNLRSFQDSNYIYTVINDKTDILSENLKPTLQATFKSKAWSGNNAGYPAIIGVYGDSAKMLYLSSTAESMTFNADGTPNPSSQVITLTANLQNVSGNVSFAATAYNGPTVVSAVTLSGVGNTRTFNQAQFPASANRVRVRATLGNLVDTVTIVKLSNGSKGQNAVVGLLTNESITLPADKDGLVPSTSFTGATGVFDVYDGITKKTRSGTVYSVVGQPTNITVEIDAKTGVYKVAAMSTGTAILNGYATLKAVYNGVTIEKQLSVSKSVTGATGASGQGVTSITEEYYLSTSKTSQTGGSWKATPDPWKPGKYQWTRSKIVYTNPTKTGYTDPVIDTSWEAIDGIQVGGRNLLPDTDKVFTNPPSPGNNVEFITLPYNLTPIFEENGIDSEYTISFDLKSYDTANTNIISVYPYPATNQINTYTFPYVSFTVTEEYKRYSMTFIPQKGDLTKDSTRMVFYGQYKTGNIPFIRRVKVEKGSKATDWTLAPEDVEASYTAVAQAKAEAERIKAESYADGKVTDEEKARIADADAKLAAAKKYAVDQILADKRIKDTRNDNQTPAWYFTNHKQQTIKEFKFTSTMGVATSEGTYGILETEIPWTDASGGPVKQTFRVNSKTFRRSGTTTSWTSWVSYDEIAETAKSDAATAKGIADGAASSASTANNLLSDIASDSKLTATEKKAAKKEWDIIVGEKPKIDSSANTYGIIAEKTAYNTAYNTLNTYLSSLLSNLNTTSNIVGTTFRDNFRGYYNARQDLLNKIADSAKSLVDGIEVGGRNLYIVANSEEGYLNGNDGDMTTAAPNGERTSEYINISNAKNITISYVMHPTPNYKWYSYSFYDANKVNIGGRPGWHLEGTENSTTTEVMTLNVPDNAVYIRVSARWLENGQCKLQVEKGTKATDWTPAPEDARTYKAWANSSEGSVDFTRVYPNENLLLESNQSITTAVYNIKDYPLADDTLTATDDVVITLKGALGADRVRFRAYNSGGSSAIGTLTPLGNGLYEYKGKWNPNGGNSYLRIYQLNSTGKSSSTIEWIKLEKGTTPTVYTTNSQDSLSGSIPKYVGFSPIDSDVPHEYEWIMNPEYAQALADEALAGKVDSDAEYENLKNMAQEVKESYENFVSEGGEYQTEHNKLLARTTKVETDLGEYREQINFVDTYMSAGNEGLIIGVKDSEGNPDANAMQMLLSNKSLSFMDGGEVVAYFSGQSFHINRGAIVESLQVGQHKITNLGNGHTVFQYTG